MTPQSYYLSRIIDGNDAHSEYEKLRKEGWRRVVVTVAEVCKWVGPDGWIVSKPMSSACVLEAWK